ncbi:EndoU domain-containing protein [Isobaculum melis]|uniref:EndoU nuclease n=1 Tax=Isobaculum melis TaxID=142588 RepID=A0A1H9TVU1_9LACT|nr:EndoU domain-containing protein [Isobaculum melis]SES01246.1 EndoU nuclease [Isobaculum melis]
MKRMIQWILFSTFIFLVGCTGQSQNEQAKTQETVVELSELKHTENFQNGALAHIFEGDINRKGKAVGFHYEGEKIKTVRGETIEGTVSQPNKEGVYHGKVKIDDITKNGFSTFFPKEWTAQEVVDQINQAYENKTFVTGNTYVGVAASGIKIEMYLNQKDQIISAFPKE